jgi:hypothetical protein
MKMQRRKNKYFVEASEAARQAPDNWVLKNKIVRYSQTCVQRTLMGSPKRAVKIYLDPFLLRPSTQIKIQKLMKHCCV